MIYGFASPRVAYVADAIMMATALVAFWWIDYEARPAIAHTETIGESLQSGLLYGTAAEVDGMVERMQKELGGHATVTATGGLVETIAPYCHRIDRVEPWLTLKGLRLIFDKNTLTE